MPFDLGDLVPLAVQITDAANAPANASAVTLTITLPDGTVASGITVTNPPTVTGTYVYDFLPTQAGRHIARWVSTTPNSAYTDSFDVRPADPGYIISLADAKTHLNKSGTSTVDDEELRAYLETATGVIERHTGKVVARRTVQERVPVSYVSELWLNYRPILSVTSIATTDGSVTWLVTSTYVDIQPDWGRISVLSGNRWNGSLLVTYVAGMSSIPPEYAMAARIIVEHLWNSQRQAGIGPSPFGAGGEAAPAPGFAIPRRALELLGAPPPMVA